MKQHEFIRNIYQKTGINKVYIKVVLDKFIEEINEAMLRDEKIKINNFGVFKTVKMDAKEFHHVNLGIRKLNPEKRKPIFKFAHPFVKKIKERSTYID